MTDKRLTAELSQGTGPGGADEVLIGVGGERHAVSVEDAMELSSRLKHACGKMDVWCSYCERLIVDADPAAPFEEIAEAVNEHEKTCEANPHRARIAELEAELERAEALRKASAEAAWMQSWVIGDAPGYDRYAAFESWWKDPETQEEIAEAMRDAGEAPSA